ncbi:MAG TPA: DUF177 domain-containing protein [Casimicrobiaceae bacterium]
MAWHELDGPKVSPLRMVERDEALAGVVDVRTLEAAGESLAEGSDPVNIDWKLAAVRNSDGRAALSLTLAGSLPMTCQRCLEVFDWPLDQETRVLVARNDAELKALDDATDDEVILGSDEIGAHVLVEDELLLSMPFAPVHPGACP